MLNLLSKLREPIGIYTLEQLKAKLGTGKRLRIKWGIDPTGKSLHLGHMACLRLLRQFQNEGHIIDIIIGDFTATIGDPTGKNKTRPVLTSEQCSANAKTYKDQIKKVLDLTDVNFHRNGDWFNQFYSHEWMQLLQQTTMQKLLERHDFQNRRRTGSPIYLHECVYPLMQAYDSVHLKADVEIGGEEQLFTMLLARDFQKNAKQEQQVAVTVPILLGSDGKKMGKSDKNFISLEDHSYDMFAKVMGIPDSVMPQWANLLASRQDLITLDKDKNVVDPFNTKKMLAFDIVEQLWNTDHAEEALREWKSRVSEGNDPKEIKEVTLPYGMNEMGILNLVQATGLVKSRMEARRLIGSISIDEVRNINPLTNIAVKDGMIVRVGKYRIARVRLAKIDSVAELGCQNL